MMRTHNAPLHLIALKLIVLLLSGCGTLLPAPTPTPTDTPKPTKTPTPEIAFEKVSFTTEDGLELSGTLFGEGDIAVVLAHQGTVGANQHSWHPFARLIAEKGFTALAFDFRGCGQSEGVLQVGLLDKDMRAAIGFLHDRGFEHIVCMCASMGGTTCLKTALDTNLVGLAVIASTWSIGESPTEIKVRPEDLSVLTMPKLFVTTEHDLYDIPAMITAMYELSPEPKEIKVFPGRVHGTDLFKTYLAGEFRELLVNFLEGLR
jgi:alpha/beta superfamily hydrolase